MLTREQKTDVRKFYLIEVDKRKYDSVISRNGNTFFTPNDEKFVKSIIVSNSMQEVYEKFGEDSIKSIEKVDGYEINPPEKKKVSRPFNIRDSKTTKDVTEYFRRINSDMISKNLLKEVEILKNDAEFSIENFTKHTEKLSEKQGELFKHLEERLKEVKEIAGDNPGVGAVNEALRDDGDYSTPRDMLGDLKYGYETKSSSKKLFESLQGGPQDYSVRNKLIKHFSNNTGLVEHLQDNFNMVYNWDNGLSGTLMKELIKEDPKYHMASMRTKEGGLRMKSVPTFYKESYERKFEGKIPGEVDFVVWWNQTVAEEEPMVVGEKERIDKLYEKGKKTLIEKSLLSNMQSNDSESSDTQPKDLNKIEVMFDNPSKNEQIEENVKKMMDDIKKSEKFNETRDVYTEPGQIIVDNGENYPNLEYIGVKTVTVTGETK